MRHKQVMGKPQGCGRGCRGGAVEDAAGVRKRMP